MPLLDVAPLEATLEIDAPPARVWELVSDLRNMARWSPQTARTFVRGGGPVREGTRTVNINRRGFLVWPTQAKVVRFVPEREIAWRVKENTVVWSYTLEPTATGTGTRLTARREAPQGISDVSVRLTKAAFGGVESFSAELARDMHRTLERIKADAEG
ncbi:SRPBCC family protein [Nocardioides caldifontis]|uniref:SRPBCC family protein n=1 Tax=Nocardioides caldifontis TaxID=2588938 RepID=UPI001EF0C172|nr:SRPBCC family protein [Nocardioides caldifontis]